jgi:hypothetical protein
MRDVSGGFIEERKGKGKKKEKIENYGIKNRRRKQTVTHGTSIVSARLMASRIAHD